MNSSEPLSFAVDDWCYGLGNIISSFCGILIYVMILKLFITSPDYNSLYAYRFMVHLGLTDMIQLFVHFFTGISVTFHWRFSPLLDRILGALLCAWIPMLFFSGVLAMNRFLQLLFPRYFLLMFSTKSMPIYLIFGWLLFVLFSTACLTPFLRYGFLPENFSWQFYGEWKPIVRAINRTEELVVVFGSAILYCIILGFIWLKSIKMSKATGGSFERRLTIQVMLICTVHIVLVLFWEFGLKALPDTKIVWYISSFVWIIWCSFNPIIYLTFNRDLRNRFLVSMRFQTNQPAGGMINVQTVIQNTTSQPSCNSTRSNLLH